MWQGRWPVTDLCTPKIMPLNAHVLYASFLQESREKRVQLLCPWPWVSKLITLWVPEYHLVASFEPNSLKREAIALIWRTLVTAVFPSCWIGGHVPWGCRAERKPNLPMPCALRKGNKAKPPVTFCPQPFSLTPVIKGGVWLELRCLSSRTPGIIEKWLSGFAMHVFLHSLTAYKMTCYLKPQVWG